VSLKTLFEASELDLPHGVVAKKSGGNQRGEKSNDFVFKVINKHVLEIVTNCT